MSDPVLDEQPEDDLEDDVPVVDAEKVTPVKPRSSKGAFRQAVRETINLPEYQTMISELVKNALSLEMDATGPCPHCKKSIRMRLPDVKRQVDTIAALLDQAEGKPGDDPGGVVIVIERPPRDVAVAPGEPTAAA